MSIIYVLIPIAILLTALGIYLFFWAVKTDQFDDLEKQGLSILFDEEENQISKPGDKKPKSDSQQNDLESDDSPSKHVKITPSEDTHVD